MRNHKTGEIIGKARKRTKNKTTKKEMADEMSVTCQCPPEDGHATVRGKAGTELQNYPKSMCQKLAKVMTCTQASDQVDFDDAFIATDFTEALKNFPEEE